MRRGSRWSRFKVLGHDVAIQFEERISTQDCGANTYFWMGDKKINLHDRNMQPRLKNLIPPAFATPRVKPHHWESFVRQAILMGIL